jgi:hypothetical protein
MKRGFDEIEFDNQYPPSIVWDNKDVVSKCLAKFLTLSEKSKLAQTCRRLYTIFNQNDQAIRFMCNIYRIDEFDDFTKKRCIVTSGILECVKFGIEIMNIYYLDCLEEIYKLRLFQHEDVISYLTSNNQFYFKSFSKMIVSSCNGGFFDFTCSLFENRNSKWMSKESFNIFRIKHSASIETLRKDIWERLTSFASLETIKKCEYIFKTDVDAELLLSTLMNNDDINVFGYLWDQTSIIVRTSNYLKLRLRHCLNEK